EALGDTNGVLTRHSISDEENFIGSHLLLQAAQLIHHLVVDLETAGGIQDHHAVPGSPRLLYPRLRYANNVRSTTVSMNRDIELPSQGFQLVYRGRAIHVTRDQTCWAPLGLQLASELSGRGRLSGSLQPDHHHD